MLIKPRHKKIILNLRDPTTVTSVIPTSRTIEYKGRTLVVVPHRTDEVRVLRNMGILAPSPVASYYKYPGMFTPFSHQRVTTEFMASHGRAFCFDDLGTGKSNSTMWAFDFLKDEGTASKALIVGPLSTLERTWADTLFKHFTHLNFAVLHGTKEKRLKELAKDVDVYLINHDGVKLLADAIARRTDIDTIIIDELAQVARNAGTDRWKALRKITTARARVWGLTGTPTPNAPTDAWAQCRLIAPERVPQYFGRFRELVMKQTNVGSPFAKYIPRADATQIVAEAMSPAIRHKRDECIDLPPVMYETRSVEMTLEQKAMYKTMVNTLSAELAGQQVIAVNEAVKAMRLVQIACGVSTDTEGLSMVIPAVNRLKVVAEIVEEAGSKTIVFVPFLGALASVAAHLRGCGIAVEIVQGSTSKNERDRIFREFQGEEHPQVIVAQPASMSHGLTLTAASVIVWFAPVNSHETYEQACGRITRPGQKLNQLIVNIEGSPVERAIYARLKDKGKMQNLLLEILKEKV